MGPGNGKVPGTHIMTGVFGSRNDADHPSRSRRHDKRRRICPERARALPPPASASRELDEAAPGRAGGDDERRVQRFELQGVTADAPTRKAGGVLLDCSR